MKLLDKKIKNGPYSLSFNRHVIDRAGQQSDFQMQSL